MNTDKPLISVVIPAYNEEKYLPACLESIKNQTFKDFELIVVDNNSSDNTARIARKFGARVVREKQQGMTPARERGFREARAEIIARTDSDSVVMPDWLDVIYSTFKRYPRTVAITGSWLSPTPKIPDSVFWDYSYLIAVRLGLLLFRHVCILGPNMALRKSAWQKINVIMDDKKVHEDYDLSCHIATVGRIRYIPKMRVVFSLRRVSENPVRGIRTYLGEYPVRFIKTLYYNKVGIFKNLPEIPKSSKRPDPEKEILKADDKHPEEKPPSLI